MEHEEVDAILSKDEELVPSSGFLASVMERVQEEAAVPPPIPFPWKRAVPGMIVATGVLGWSGVELGRYALEAFAGGIVPTAAQMHSLASISAPIRDTGMVALSLLAPLLSWMLARRMTGRSGLL